MTTTDSKERANFEYWASRDGVAVIEPVAPDWWRKRADEIEAQVAATGSTEAMRCYTDMRTLLQAAAHPSPPEGMVSAYEVENLRRALQFYANKDHFDIADEMAWDTVSGEPQNYWCDEAGTAMVEDGSIAKMALAGHHIQLEEDDDEAAPPTSSADSRKGGRQ